jgi:DNA polymerase I-like protein with 3'-5' exonuclease and polymerase domains
MQNWPPVARRMVVSRYKGGQILAVDYSKLEVVLFAWLAKDEKLFDYFYNGKGYIGIAAELFGKTVEKDTPIYTMTKSTVLAVQYNAKDWKIAMEFWFKLGIKLAKRFNDHVEKVGEIRQRYLRLFPGIPRFVKARKQELIETGKVEIIPGMYRNLPGYANAPTKWARKHLLNEAVNAPVQGLASIVTGSALIDVEAALVKANGLTLLEHYDNLLRGKLDYSVLINEVHDELVTDLHPAHRQRDQELVMSTMQAPPTLRALVPSLDFKLKLEAKWGPTWTK